MWLNRGNNRILIRYSLSHSIAAKQIEVNQLLEKKNWDILKSDSLLKEALPDCPTISFRRAPTVNDKLVKSHLTLYNRKPGRAPDQVTASVVIEINAAI